MADPYKWLWGDDEADFWGDVAPDYGFGYDDEDYRQAQEEYYFGEATPTYEPSFSYEPQTQYGGGDLIGEDPYGYYTQPTTEAETYYDQYSFLNLEAAEEEEQQQGFDMLAYEEEYGKSWVDELQESVSGAARTSREFLSGLTGIPTGDIAKIAGYFMPRKGEKTRSSFQGPQRRQLPTASLRGKPQMSAAGRSPGTDEVIKNMIASNRTTSTAANSARSQTANGQAAIFKNLTDKLGEYSEIQTGATKPKGPNIPQSEIRLTPRREIT